MAVVCCFVELGDLRWLVVAERCEDGADEGDVVGAWLAAVLEEWVVWIFLREGLQAAVGEVEVVEGED